MADNEHPPAESTLQAGSAEQNKQQPAAPPPPYGAWPPPTPDTFREFSSHAPWPPQQPMPMPPTGYPPQAPVGAPGYGYWPQISAPPGQGTPGNPPPPTWPQAPATGWPQPGQPASTAGQQQPPPAKTSPLLIALFGGLAALVILVPILLLLLSHPSTSTQPGTVGQPTATAGRPNPTTTPTPAAGAAPFYKPAGTAPTSKDCMNSLGAPCYSPQQMQQAFGLVSLYKQGIDGTGQTIVIIGAGHTDTVHQDLLVFDKAWGLPDPPSFKVLQPFGPPVPYSCGKGGGDGLEEETTLDVEWSHAMAPGASIVVVIGANNERKIAPPPNENKCGLDYLEDDVAYALDNHLGNVISISYGGSEMSAPNERPDEKANDKNEFTNAHAIFQRAAQENVTILASSGDAGATNFGMDINNPETLWNIPTVSWPASDPYILGIGGTTLTTKDDSGTYKSEVAWNNPGSGGATGGGLSVVYPEPDYQKTVSDQSIFQGKRGVPDIAFPADVNYSLYLTASAGEVNPVKWPHWTIIGGTSASSPSLAGVLTLANQMRGKPVGDIHAALYSLQGQGLNDITQGDNSFAGVQGYKALPGYDLVTGWGTPIGEQFIPNLIQALG